ncbi:MAG: hypothetical protein FD149_200 [Rhodospirillaceae bacterium]|nr:MAG: hypothetical protein FD149_200 [Rhodospirillaceae bacterium]
MVANLRNALLLVQVMLGVSLVSRVSRAERDDVAPYRWVPARATSTVEPFRTTPRTETGPSGNAWAVSREERGIGGIAAATSDLPLYPPENHLAETDHGAKAQTRPERRAALAGSYAFVPSEQNQESPPYPSTRMAEPRFSVGVPYAMAPPYAVAPPHDGPSFAPHFAPSFAPWFAPRENGLGAASLRGREEEPRFRVSVPGERPLASNRPEKPRFRLPAHRGGPPASDRPNGPAERRMSFPPGFSAFGWPGEPFAAPMAPAPWSGGPPQGWNGSLFPPPPLAHPCPPPRLPPQQGASAWPSGSIPGEGGTAHAPVDVRPPPARSFAFVPAVGRPFPPPPPLAPWREPVPPPPGPYVTSPWHLPQAVLKAWHGDWRT